jgi:hypothetical protein
MLAKAKLTVKAALVVVPVLPSTTLASLITIGGGGSMIVAVPRLVLIAALVALLKSTKKVSLPSGWRSLATGTVIGCVVCPGRKVNVPVRVM